MFRRRVQRRTFNSDARPHRRRDGEALHVLALGGGRFRPDDTVNERLGVGDEVRVTMAPVTGFG